MIDGLRGVLLAFDVFVLVYFLVLNSIYLAIVVMATLAIARTWRADEVAGHDDIFANPLAPGVSIIVPAYNEALCVVEATRGLIGLKYPEFEVIVVDDGSTDDSFALLQAAFDLVEVERVIPHDVPTLGALRSVYMARTGDPLTVASKENTGRCSDPINLGINLARYPLICIVDADSILDEDALLRVVKPFVDDPASVVAVGGVIRVANDSPTERGRLLDPRMPRSWLARVQVLEYLRSFLFGRTAWGRIGGLLIVSGAFGLFRRDVVVEIGGLDLHCIGEDAELVTRIHHELRRRHMHYRLAFVPDPVCWTEVPDTLAALGGQRRRWGQGLAEVLWKHRAMMGNPRYGTIGTIVLPYYLVFELLGAVVELFGLFAVALSLLLGVVNTKFALVFFAVAVGYAVFLSVAAVAVEEFSFHRYPGWRDFGTVLVTAVIENIGYRQIHAWWRLRGLGAALRGKGAVWGTIPRRGFSDRGSG